MLRNQRNNIESFHLFKYFLMKFNKNSSWKAKIKYLRQNDLRIYLKNCPLGDKKQFLL